jgi:hypothetical protein
MKQNEGAARRGFIVVKSESFANPVRYPNTDCTMPRSALGVNGF